MKNRAYKYRFYPTEEQKQSFAKTFGCCRFVYNWGLKLRTDAYYERQEKIFYDETSAALTQLKKDPEKEWLNEVSAVCLQQALRHLDRAFRNFFDGFAKYPTFKKKHGKQSATYASSAFSWDDKELHLAKMSEPLNIVWSRPLGGKPSIVTVSKDFADRYFVSILVTEDIKPFLATVKMAGIDLGIKDAVVLNSGEKFGNPRVFSKNEKKLAIAQRGLSKKQKGSKNRAKAKLKVAKIHARIADRRSDFLHKLSTKLVNENQVLAVESLQVKNMIKNHHLSKAISDVGWGEFVRQLQYKSHWYGRTFVAIDKFYPSSKRCSNCGHIMDKMPLDVRFWVCPECDTAHDRDINAAKNILSAGLTINVGGELVRPSRKKK